MTAPLPGTTIPAGDPTPPTTTAKAVSAFWWGLVPVVLAAAVVVLQNATTLFTGAPTWVATTCAVLLLILSPVSSYIGTYRTPNKLKTPVMVLSDTATNINPIATTGSGTTTPEKDS